jgi:hypothetical protein
VPTHVDGEHAYGDITARLVEPEISGRPPSIEMSKKDLPWLVTVRLEPIDGLPRIVAISIQPAGFRMRGRSPDRIDVKALQRLPLREFEQVATQMLATRAIGGRAAVVQHGRRGPVGPSPAALRLVAEIYTADLTGAPTRAVEDELHLSPRTASRWVKAARERWPELFEGEDQ